MEEIDRDLLENLQSLLRHPGWARLDELLYKQIAARMRETFGTPLASVEDALQRNYKQGVIDGLRFARKFPKVIVEGKLEEFKEWLEDERSTSSDG